MSIKLTALVARAEIGSPTRKQVLMRLADRADDDGLNAWPSKRTVARETELGLSSVKRAFIEMEEDGIIIKTGTRTCRNGYTNVYCLNLEKIESLVPLCEHASDPGLQSDPVQIGPSTGSVVDLVPGPQRTPNLPKTTLKPPTHKRDPSDLAKAQEILNAFPKDRLRGEESCLSAILEVFDSGIPEADLLAVVRAYATKTQGYTRGKVSFSDNWFRSDTLSRYVGDYQEKVRNSAIDLAAHNERMARWIKEGDPMIKHISQPQVILLLTEDFVTKEELRAAGLEVERA